VYGVGVGSLNTPFSAYLLAAGAFGPLYGKLSNMFGKPSAWPFAHTQFLIDMLGRKPILYSSIIIFLVRTPVPHAAPGLIIAILGRIRALRSGAEHELVGYLQSYPGYRRRRHHSACRHHDFRHRSIERVSTMVFAMIVVNDSIAAGSMVVQSVLHTVLRGKLTRPC
jgi:MFS family permease